MVILHVAQLYKNPFSGVEVVVPEHVIHQQEKEDVALINLADVKIEGIKNQFNVSKIRDLKNLPKPFNSPDLVVFHEVYKFKFLLIAKFFKRQGTPYIILPHISLTNQAQKIKKWKKLIGNYLFFNRFIYNASAIHCLSKLEKKQTNFNVEKFVCTNGIEIPNIESRVFNRDGIRVVFIGRLSIFHKGLDIFVDAVSKIKNFLRDNKVTVDLYGPSEEGSIELLKRQINSCGVSDLIQINHPVFGIEKKQILMGADVFIQTSRSEGMPMGILEALSYGLPCVVTEGTALKDFIIKYNAGWGADGSAESVSNAIKKAVENKNQLNVFSKNARKLVEENFSWDIVADNTLRKYREKWANKK